MKKKQEGSLLCTLFSTPFIDGCQSHVDDVKFVGLVVAKLDGGRHFFEFKNGKKEKDDLSIKYPLLLSLHQENTKYSHYMFSSCHASLCI